MKCPQCHYNYERSEITKEHHDLECAHTKKYGKCIACTYEELPKNNRLSFGHFVRDARERLQGKDWRRNEILYNCAL